MCILFVHINPEPKEGEYRLIVAANRDEYYRRPARDAYKCNETFIIGGKDMEPGREGGMWLGFATKELDNGKKKHCFSALLNITGEKTVNADGRGVLVKDYLITKEDFTKYVKKFENMNFNGFNLVAAELSEDGCTTFQHSNRPKIDSIYSGKQTLAFGNSPILFPFNKVTTGGHTFENIINGSITEEELVEELLKLLKDETSYLPDKELQKRAPIAYKRLSSPFIAIEDEGYGTRAHTIILIDYDWNLQFIEHALAQPIDIKNPSWNVNKIHSTL